MVQDGRAQVVKTFAPTVGPLDARTIRLRKFVLREFGMALTSRRSTTTLWRALMAGIFLEQATSPQTSTCGQLWATG